jgi:hypothetical protein
LDSDRISTGQKGKVRKKNKSKKKKIKEDHPVFFQSLWRPPPSSVTKALIEVPNRT